MASLKGILFSQFAGEGLNKLVEEMQNKFKPKKGRRFNHNNITYEISRPVLEENQLVYEISSKIPQDELKDSEAMKTYFQEIKTILENKSNKPASIEMENIVWDSKDEAEKEREYVKLLFRYPLEELYDDQEVKSRYESLSSGENQGSLPEIPGVFTEQGKVALMVVKDTIQDKGRDNIQSLIEANNQVREVLKN